MMVEEGVPEEGVACMSQSGEETRKPLEKKKKKKKQSNGDALQT